MRYTKQAQGTHIMVMIKKKHPCGKMFTGIDIEFVFFKKYCQATNSNLNRIIQRLASHESFSLVAMDTFTV